MLFTLRFIGGVNYKKLYTCKGILVHLIILILHYSPQKKKIMIWLDFCIMLVAYLDFYKQGILSNQISTNLTNLYRFKFGHRVASSCHRHPTSNISRQYNYHDIDQHGLAHKDLQNTILVILVMSLLAMLKI